MAQKVFVGSIFKNDLDFQPQWLDLQLKCIQQTTSNFEHVAVVSEGLTNSCFSDKTTVIVPENQKLEWSEAHLQGLKILLNFFKEQNCPYFLFLDGDAFPIKQNWLNELTSRMRPQEVFQNGCAFQTSGKQLEIAVALRSENLENRLHASILFAKKEALNHLDFCLGTNPQPDLLNNRETDIYLTPYQTERRDKAFPLMRSNQFNVHPVACGVYYDCFYHHCCGSGRGFQVRGRNY